tara:strand:+ start:1296 stop:2126 length:831 start_codon:yes stop_codon:yes gene_type:complete
MSAQINQLFIYPVKSCAGISVSKIQLDERGPVFDRWWMLVDAKTGVFLSQREIPQMALISTRITDGCVWVDQSLNSSLVASHRLPISGRLVDVDVWSDHVDGYDCGDEISEWFSALLNHDCRLIYQGDCERLADETYADKNTLVSFADGFPLLVVAQSSIDEMNAACEGVISSINFRPNIVVVNTPAFAEIDWKELCVENSESGEYIKMRVVKRCQRCVIPMLNPATAKRDANILPVLLKYCRENKEIYFGQNLTFRYAEGLTLRVGQGVDITSEH